MRTVPLKRTPVVGRFTLIWCLTCCVIVLLASAAAAQGGRLEIEYTVKVADIPGQLFHVTTDIMVDGKPHEFVANPAGVFSAEKTRTLIGHLTKLAETQGKIFGGLPYRKFVYFYFFRPAEASATVLEHQNSYVALMNAGAQTQPDDMAVQASHEFFHVWNVKRIRPVQMWPYDYARENETPLLWVSEGFTNYYASLARYRAGLKDARSFVDEVARTIADVEGNEARRYISASDASTSTWIRIRRGDEERELEVAVGSVELVNYRIVDSKSPTPEQLKIRERWLKR